MTLPEVGFLSRAGVERCSAEKKALKTNGPEGACFESRRSSPGGSGRISIFFHPDCTVGTGISPVQSPLRGESRAITAGRELPTWSSPGPENQLNNKQSLFFCQEAGGGVSESRFNAFPVAGQTLRKRLDHFVVITEKSNRHLLMPYRVPPLILFGVSSREGIQADGGFPSMRYAIFIREDFGASSVWMK